MNKTITGVDYEDGRCVGVMVSGITGEQDPVYFERARHGTQATEKGKLTMGKRLIYVGKRLIDARQIEERAKNMENLAFKKVCYTRANSPFYPIYSEQFSEITQFRKLILNAPTVDAVPVVHARWLVKGQDIYCSYCDGESGYTAFGGSAFSKFCPNCGAKMDLED